MVQKPTYQELEQKILDLENELKRERSYVSDDLDLKKYKNIVENISSIINVFLPDTTEVYVNKAFEQTFEVNRHEILGKQIFDFIPEEERNDLINYLNSFTQDNPVGTYKNSVLLNDGTKRFFYGQTMLTSMNLEILAISLAWDRT